MLRHAVWSGRDTCCVLLGCLWELPKHYHIEPSASWEERGHVHWARGFVSKGRLWNHLDAGEFEIGDWVKVFVWQVPDRNADGGKATMIQVRS